jgi:hypothetical protein
MMKKTSMIATTAASRINRIRAMPPRYVHLAAAASRGVL